MLASTSMIEKIFEELEAGKSKLSRSFWIIYPNRLS